MFLSSGVFTCVLVLSVRRGPGFLWLLSDPAEAEQDADELQRDPGQAGEGIQGDQAVSQQDRRWSTHPVLYSASDKGIWRESNAHYLDVSNLSPVLPLFAPPAGRTAFSVALFDYVFFQCFGPFAVNTNVIYKHVLLNLANSYRADTGIFTVPCSGVYSIAVTIYSDAGSLSRPLAACGNLQVNGQAVSGSSERNQDDQEDSASIIVALQLKAGDEVAVNLPAGCFLCEYSSYFNTFSAFLLYPTE